MRSNRDSRDLGFDVELAKKCADNYSSSTGMRCIVINSLGDTIYEACTGSGLCGFCRSADGLLGKKQSCSNTHLYGGYQAERFGGLYVFFCPMGLVHWASPITKDGLLKGTILGGPVQMVEPEEFLIDDILAKHNITGTQLLKIKKYIADIPIVRPETVNSLSEMLFITAVYISDIQPSKYLEERELHQQQSNISEYIHYIKTMGGNQIELENYPLKKEKELLTMITLGDKPGSQKLLNEIFGHIFFLTGGVFEVIKARVLELVVLLSRAALQGGADAEQIFGLNYKYLNEINSFHTVEDLAYWLSKIMTRFTDCVFNLTDVKHVDVIYKTIDYLKLNYMKKITLEDVANHVYLSPSYFSKVFKEEMKLNFNTYLNNVRIKMSKKLLLDEKIPLVDVSSLVGYEDQSYFSKVFKKVVGVTPGKYRESRGQFITSSS